VKTKDSGEYVFYLASFLIILNVRLCWHLWLVMHKCWSNIYPHRQELLHQLNIWRQAQELSKC